MASPFTDEEVTKLLDLEAAGKVPPSVQVQINALRKDGQLRGPLSVKEQSVRSLERVSEEGASVLLPESVQEALPSTPGEKLRLGLEVGGGMVGGAGGATAGRVAGQVLSKVPAVGGLGRVAAKVSGAPAGAGVGGAAGSLAAEPIDPSEKPVERALQTGVAEAVGEGVARVGIGAARKVFGGAKRITPGGEFTMDFLGSKGHITTPGQITESRFVDILETISEGSFMGGGRILETRGKASDVITGSVDEIVSGMERFGLKEELGTAVQGAVRGSLDSFKASARRLFAEVDESALRGEFAGVDTTAMKARAATLKKELEAGIIAREDPALSMVDQVLAKADRISFAEAQTLRSDLLGAARSTNEAVPGRVETFGKLLAGEADGAIGKAFQSLPAETKMLWRKANAFWKNGKDTFNNRMVKSVISRDPDQVLPLLAVKNRPVAIKRIRDVIGRAPHVKGEPSSDEVWKGAQGAVLRDMMNAASPPGQELLGKNFVKAMKGFGDEAADEMFGKPQAELLRKLGRALEITQGPATGEGTGKVFIQLKQAGALTEVGGMIMGVGGIASPGTAATIVLGPAAVARMFTSPAIVNTMLKGIKAPPNSKLATRLTAQLIGNMAKEKVISTEEATSLRLQMFGPGKAPDEPRGTTVELEQAVGQ